MLLLGLSSLAAAVVPLDSPAVDDLLNLVFVDNVSCDMARDAVMHRDGVICAGSPRTPSRQFCFDYLVLHCAYPDRDADGVRADEDCDDEDSGVGGTVQVYTDGDADGWGASGAFDACEGDPGTVLVTGDCDDHDDENYPGATERVDGEDNDCDGTIDEGDTGIDTGDTGIEETGIVETGAADTDCTEGEGWSATVEATYSTSRASQIAVDEDVGVFIVPAHSDGNYAGVYALEGGAMMASIPAEGLPNPVVIDDIQDQVFIGNAASGTVTVVERFGYAPLTKLYHLSNAQHIVFDRDLNRIYVMEHDSGEVTSFDAATLSRLGRVRLEHGLRQSTYANGVLYVIGNAGIIHVIDTATFTEVDSLAVTTGWIFGSMIVPELDRLYVSDYTNSQVLVLEASTLTLLNVIPMTGPCQMAVDPARGIVAVAGYGDDTVSFIDVATDHIVATAPTCADSTDVAFAPASGLWYVTCYAGRSVVVVSLEESSGDCGGDTGR